MTTMTSPPEGDRPYWLIPLKDRPPPPPAPDSRPLDEAELTELRARLDAPGGSRITLPYRERRAYRAQLGIIRAPERVQALVRQVNHESADSSTEGQAYAAGVLDAVAWATGRRRDGPITGDVPAGERPRVAEVEREEYAAVDVLEGRRESIHPRAYVNGVEACLMWLVAGCDEPPWGGIDT